MVDEIDGTRIADRGESKARGEEKMLEAGGGGGGREKRRRGFFYFRATALF